MLDLTLQGADVLTPAGLDVRAEIGVAEGRITANPQGRRVDLSGYMVLSGIIDPHGDGFERHLAPRRGAMKQMTEGVVAAEAELAANGITTAVLAQFYSWEGGLRSPDYAAQVFSAIQNVRSSLVTDLVPQLRFETHMLGDYEGLPDKITQWGVTYIVFNDHLDHDRLAAGKKPARLTGQALKAGRNPDKHFEMLLQMHRRSHEVPAALELLCKELLARGLRVGSHDDKTAEGRAIWRARGAQISEFPETLEAAEGGAGRRRPDHSGGPQCGAGWLSQGQCLGAGSDCHGAV